jgi:hypothetical protein
VHDRPTAARSCEPAIVRSWWPYEANCLASCCPQLSANRATPPSAQGPRSGERVRPAIPGAGCSVPAIPEQREAVQTFMTHRESALIARTAVSALIARTAVSTLIMRGDESALIACGLMRRSDRHAGPGAELDPHHRAVEPRHRERAAARGAVATIAGDGASCHGPGAVVPRRGRHRQPHEPAVQRTHGIFDVNRGQSMHCGARLRGRRSSSS